MIKQSGVCVVGVGAVSCVEGSGVAIFRGAKATDPARIARDRPTEIQRFLASGPIYSTISKKNIPQYLPACDQSSAGANQGVGILGWQLFFICFRCSFSHFQHLQIR